MMMIYVTVKTQEQTADLALLESSKIINSTNPKLTYKIWFVMQLTGNYLIE